MEYNKFKDSEYGNIVYWHGPTIYVNVSFLKVAGHVRDHWIGVIPSTLDGCYSYSFNELLELQPLTSQYDVTIAKWIFNDVS